MKKILILNYEFPPLGGGGGVATYKLAKGFIANGHEVDYLTSWYNGLKKFEKVDGINVYRIKVLGRKGLQTATMISLVTFPIFAFLKGFSLCRKNKYEFINTQFVLPTGPLGFILSKIFKIKNILSTIGGDIYDPSKKSSPHRHFIFKILVKYLINKADKITAISNNTKSNVIKYYGIKKDIKIVYIPYEPIVFESKTKKDLGLDENKKYIIGVGRLIKRKGFEYFIKALSKLDNSIEGIIIGDGPEKENLLKLAKDLKIEKRLHLVGFISEEKKFQYLDNSDIFVLSSIHEGFGIVLQEAMQVGLPIVATNNGGQVDLVKDGENGYLVSVGNERELSNKINIILRDREEIEKIKKNNLEKIKDFNIKNISKKYLSLIYG